MSVFWTLLLPYLEPVLAVTAALILVLRHHHSTALWLMSYAAIVLICKNPSPALDVFSAHPLALAHIFTSWCAKITLLTAICMYFEGSAIRHAASLRRNQRVYLLCPGNLGKANTPRLPLGNILKLGTFYQAIAITLGMFWAFDAPAWGALWQWDFIELSALAILICTCFWQKWPQHSIFWAALTLITFTTQNLMLYGMADITHLSRHTYGSSNSALAWTIAVMLWTTALWIRGGKKHLLTSLEPSTSQVFVAQIAFVTCILLSGILPQSAISQWASLETTAPFQLIGIRAQKQETCTQYSIEIAASSQTVQLPLIACQEHSSPQGHADIWYGFSRFRLWALQYRADSGVELLVRPITADSCLQGCLMFALLGWLFFATNLMFLPTKKPKLP